MKPKMWDRNHFLTKSERNGDVQAGACTGRTAAGQDLSCGAKNGSRPLPMRNPFSNGKEMRKLVERPPQWKSALDDTRPRRVSPLPLCKPRIPSH